MPDILLFCHVVLFYVIQMQNRASSFFFFNHHYLTSSSLKMPLGRVLNVLGRWALSGPQNNLWFMQTTQEIFVEWALEWRILGVDSEAAFPWNLSCPLNPSTPHCSISFLRSVQIPGWLCLHTPGTEPTGPRALVSVLSAGTTWALSHFLLQLLDWHLIFILADTVRQVLFSEGHVRITKSLTLWGHFTLVHGKGHLYCNKKTSCLIVYFCSIWCCKVFPVNAELWKEVY